MEGTQENQELRRSFEYRIAHGDSSAWVGWRPEYIDAKEILDAWEEPIKRRGEPGFPDMFHFYTHFAFCRYTCSFCMYWHKVPEQEDAYKDYADYLIERLARFKERYGKVQISTAYFGGGTPTAMPLVHLKRYLKAVRAAFEITGEFTVEANPVTLNNELLQVLDEAGVNRISMGIQSTDSQVLKNITRRNGPHEEIKTFVQAAEEKNIYVNLDLCIGLPGQTPEIVAHDVEMVGQIRPSCITMYPYQPVKRLPFDTPGELELRNLLSPTSEVTDVLKPLDAIAANAGYTKISMNRNRARLRHADESPSPRPQYACFPWRASHLIGMGPASFNHVFAHSWTRDVTRLEGDSLKDNVYAGTRLSGLDELRQVFLCLLGAFGAVKTMSDYDTGFVPAEVFATQIEEGVRSGLLICGDPEYPSALKLRPDIPEDERFNFLSSFIPEGMWKSPMKELPILENVNRELLSTRRTSVKKEITQAVIRWRELLGIPLAGRKFKGVWVASMDDRSVSFGVNGRNASALRVFIYPRGERKGVAESANFVIGYHGEQLSEKEHRFLSVLTDETLQKDPRAENR